MFVKGGEIDFSIVTACDGYCPYCYVDKCGGSNAVFKELGLYGDTETLKKIIRNISVAAGAEDLVFVGGDPCRHPDLAQLLSFAKETDESMRTIVLSNTLTFRLGGRIIPIDYAATYIDDLNFTVHGIGAAHDKVNGNLGAFDNGMGQLRRFIECRKDRPKHVGIVLNFVPYTMAHLEEMMLDVIERLGMDPERDYFLVQRIAPIGRASLDYERWKTDPKLLVRALEVIEDIRTKKGFITSLDSVDAFPWCAIPEKYHHLLTPGGCKWGQPGGVLSVLQNGGIQRCALSGRILGNMLDMDTPEKFTEFMMNDPTLIAFREKRHLGQKCLSCSMLEKCGGGCVIAAGNGDPYNCDTVRTGVDYLAM